jgi:hypothetical protein
MILKQWNAPLDGQHSATRSGPFISREIVLHPDGPESGSGHCGRERENSQPFHDWNPGRPARRSSLYPLSYSQTLTKHTQWNLDISLSCMHCFLWLLVQFVWVLNKSYFIQTPHLSFSRMHRSFSGPLTWAMGRDFTAHSNTNLPVVL